MKQGVLVCVCLVLCFVFCAPVFAQPNTKSVETILIDNFDDRDAVSFDWKVQTSRSIHVGEGDDVYPKMGYVEGIPNSLRGYRTASDPTPYVLGVQTKFDRKGDNWFEIYPVDKESGEIFEIPLKGTTSQIDFWAWGANYNYYLEVLIRDAEGCVHVLPAATMNYQGWRNIVVGIPTSIHQRSRLRSGPETANFVGFRIRSDANEYVDDFVIYFDQLRYTTHTMNFIYDGFELRKPNFDSEEAGR
ncbi:MAG: flagellar filament outer layer protein FlaA [Treponemataceae bacterium]|nr:flagellar filament outer layer protein FlaA [Treponemataceae bacterium]